MIVVLVQYPCQIEGSKHSCIYTSKDMQLLFSLINMTRFGNTKNVVLSRWCLLVNMINGVKLSYYRGNKKT